MTKTIKTIAIETTQEDTLLADLQALQDKVHRFQSLPYFGLLLSISNPLTVAHFVPTKGNTNPLCGKRELIVASPYTEDLSGITIPALPDFDTMIGLANGIDPLDVTGRMRNDFLNTDAGKQYAVIRNLHIAVSKIDLADIKARYAHYKRLSIFLTSNNDSSLYDLPIWDREFINKLSDVSQDVKNLFLQCHTKALQHFPIITRKGVKVADLDLTVCNFDSYSNITAILLKMSEHDASKKDCVFWSHGLNEFIAQYSKRADFDPFVLCLFLRKFDSNAGAKQNLTQTTSSFKDLYPSA